MPPVTRDVALVVIGAVFTLLGLIGNIRIKEFILEVSKVQRCSLAAIGVILLASGIFADNIFPPKVTAIIVGKVGSSEISLFHDGFLDRTGT
jgi:multisubunit Na+/H+ antiporter MnhG subunit